MNTSINVIKHQLPSSLRVFLGKSPKNSQVVLLIADARAYEILEVAYLRAIIESEFMARIISKCRNAVTNLDSQQSRYIPYQLFLFKVSFNVFCRSISAHPASIKSNKHRKGTKGRKMEIVRMTIVSYHRVHLRLCLWISLIYVSVCCMRDLVHFTIASSGYPLRVYRWIYLNRYIERRYARTDYPQNVCHYDYVTLRSRCTWHVRSSSALYVIGKRVLLPPLFLSLSLSFCLSRYSYFLYARWSTAALPIDYRDLIFLLREISLKAALPYFLSLAYAYVKGYIETARVHRGWAAR